MTGNLYTIFFLVMLGILLVLTGLMYADNQLSYKKEDKHRHILNMTNDAIFIAIIIVMTFTPNIGYLSIAGGVITFTLLHLPVLLGASLMGWKRGALYGFLFGLSNWIRALTAATSAFDMLFMNPLISILPRFLFGLIAGLLFEIPHLFKKNANQKLLLGALAAVSTVIHTVLVFGSIYVFLGGETAWLWAWLFGGDASALGMTALALTALGASGEAILGALFTPTLNIILKKALPKAWPSLDKKALKN
jgi:uncharacterized membrane protein